MAAGSEGRAGAAVPGAAAPPAPSRPSHRLLRFHKPQIGVLGQRLVPLRRGADLREQRARSAPAPCAAARRRPSQLPQPPPRCRFAAAARRYSEQMRSPTVAPRAAPSSPSSSGPPLLAGGAAEAAERLPPQRAEQHRQTTLQQQQQRQQARRPHPADRSPQTGRRAGAGACAAGAASGFVRALRPLPGAPGQRPGPPGGGGRRVEP